MPAVVQVSMNTHGIETHLDMRRWNYLVSHPRFIKFEKTEPVGLEGKTLCSRSHVKLHFAPKPAHSWYVVCGSLGNVH